MFKDMSMVEIYPPSTRDCISVALMSGLFLRVFQNPHDREDCVPVACGRRHTEQPVDLAEIADRPHVATVHSKDESVFRGNNSHEPLPAWRKCEGNISRAPARSRQDAHESNDIGT